jgi:tRNA threonylcarbamoyl adenosine modification protein YeaZ
MSDVLTLVMDRSTESPGVAVYEGTGLLFARQWEGSPSRSPAWMDDFAKELRAHAVAPESLGRFVCGLGPGSFSGIRAALSALQGMALPGRVTVEGAASSAALALGVARGDDELVTVLGDARRERLWLATYRVTPSLGRVRLADGSPATHTSSDFRLVAAGELAKAVPQDALAVTPDYERLEPLLRELPSNVRVIARPVFPLAADLGRIAVLDSLGTVREPSPIYLHPAVIAANLRPLPTLNH